MRREVVLTTETELIRHAQEHCLPRVAAAEPRSFFLLPPSTLLPRPLSLFMFLSVHSFCPCQRRFLPKFFDNEEMVRQPTIAVASFAAKANN